MDFSGSVEVVVARMFLAVGALVIVYVSEIAQIPQRKIGMM